MKIGVIGCGRRLKSVLKMMIGFNLGVELSAVMDIKIDEKKLELKDDGFDINNITFYEDPDIMLDNEELDGVMIGTRCSLHAHMAQKVLKRNLTLFLEKPVATNIHDLKDLRDAYQNSKSQVVVSFPLRFSPIISTVKEILDFGRIGSVEHVQAYNNVPYGGGYYHKWYRDERETGGLFLQKTTHDFDYINYLLGKQPVMVCAMKSKQVFKGNKPAGLKCKDCDEYYTCRESPHVLKYNLHENVVEGMCCFAEDTGNEDSGSALIRYDTGMHVAYSQNFHVRKMAGKRGARFLGDKGSLEFDWYTDEIIIKMNYSPTVETIKFNMDGIGHFGGDDSLLYHFVNVLAGREVSKCPLEDGLLSALMCIAAKESSETNEFKEIKW